MAADGVRSLLGSWTEYFAAFGGLAGGYVALRLSFVLLNIIKTYVLGKSAGITSLLRYKGQWAGSCMDR